MMIEPGHDVASHSAQTAAALPVSNLLADLPAPLPEELVQILVHTPVIRIERIVSLGHKSSADFWYAQDENEWVLLVTGSARLQFEDEIVEMRAGSFVNITAHRRHRVDWTDPEQPTVWLAVWYR